MQCPRCGAQNPTGNLYCGNCGAMLPPPAQTAPGLAGQQQPYQTPELPEQQPYPTTGLPEQQSYPTSGLPEQPPPYQAPGGWQPQAQPTRSNNSRVWLIALSLLLFGALALLLFVGSRLNSRNAAATAGSAPAAQVAATPADGNAAQAPSRGVENPPAAAPKSNSPANPPASNPAPAQPPAVANPPANAPVQAQPPAPANPKAQVPPPAANPPAPVPAQPQPAAAPAGPADTGPQLAAQRLDRAPTIDGKLGEWEGASQAVDAIVFGQENMSGVGDLGGRIWLAWDNDALYIAVLAIDDSLSQPSSGRQLYQGDSIEIQWDTNPPGSNPAAWDADDWHIGLSPGDFQGRPPESYIWTPRESYGSDAGVRMAAQPFTNNGQYQGYTIEAAIPWRLVNVRPQVGQTFRLAVSISDDDGAQPMQESMVSTSPGRQWHRPDTLNTLVLK